MFRPVHEMKLRNYEKYPINLILTTFRIIKMWIFGSSIFWKKFEKYRELKLCSRKDRLGRNESAFCRITTKTNNLNIIMGSTGVHLGYPDWYTDAQICRLKPILYSAQFVCVNVKPDSISLELDLLKKTQETRLKEIVETQLILGVVSSLSMNSS